MVDIPPASRYSVQGSIAEALNFKMRLRDEDEEQQLSGSYLHTNNGLSIRLGAHQVVMEYHL